MYSGYWYKIFCLITENLQLLKPQHQFSLELAGFGNQLLNFHKCFTHKNNNYVQLRLHSMECSVFLYSNETILITQQLESKPAYNSVSLCKLMKLVTV
jgi:hypothetical protein